MLSAFNGATRCLPSLQATVQHRHARVPAPLQHPPRSAAVVHTVAVVHHYLGGGLHTRSAQPGSKLLPAGQGVASPTGFVGAGAFVAQVSVQVHILRPRDMHLYKRLWARGGVHQVKTAIPYLQGRAARLQGLELACGDYGGVHGASLLGNASRGSNVGH